jgi:hypothetical protein
MNLNGDYISDALAAQVGGIGIAPGANINYDTGHAMFEATHGTAPKYAGKDKVNPGSLLLSGEMMLRHLGWTEAADLIIKGIDGAIGAKTVTYDFERLMDGATKLKCSEFGDANRARSIHARGIAPRFRGGLDRFRRAGHRPAACRYAHRSADACGQRRGTGLWRLLAGCRRRAWIRV